MKDNTKQEYLSVGEVAIMYGIAEYTVREWAKKGILPAVKIEKQWFFPKDEVMLASDNRPETPEEHVEGEIVVDKLKENE